jgi:hypothetical protein
MTLQLIFHILHLALAHPMPCPYHIVYDDMSHSIVQMYLGWVLSTVYQTQLLVVPQIAVCNLNDSAVNASLFW